MASNFDFKAPPSLLKCGSYETWLKEIKIWQRFTNLDPKKQGPAIFLTLEGTAREAVLEIDVDDISSDAGVDTIVTHLDKIFLKDKKLAAYEAYEKFENFKRTPNMSIRDFINEFERLYSKVKEFKSEMSSDILAYRLLKSANLSIANEQLAKATVVELEYEKMKAQHRKIFGDSGSAGESPEGNIKLEPVFEVTDEVHDTFFESNFYGQNNSQQYSRGKTFQGRTRGSGNRGFYSRPGRGGNTNYRTTNARRGRNPTNNKGQITRCSVCDSINHWAVNCPDAIYYGESVGAENEKDYDDNHEVTLYQSNMVTDEQMKTFVAESFNSAILDSGATTSVAGRLWYRCYVDALPVQYASNIRKTKSTNSFKFGSGKVYPSLCKVTIPAQIGSRKVDIELDVVEAEIPLLLS